MPNDIVAPGRNTGAQLEANETSFLNKDVLDVAVEAKDAVVDALTPESNTGPVAEPTKPFNIIAQREGVKSYDPNSIGFLSSVAHEVENGLTSNLYGLVSDYVNEQPYSPELEDALAAKSEALVTKYGWDSTIMDELQANVQSVEELERKAERIFEQKAYMASLENTSMGQQLAAGFTGFMLDPVNLIPGGLVIRGGAATAKVFPKVAQRLTSTTVGKTGTYAAMAAVEEAARNYPRLLNDPTYSYEMYKMDVAIGAAFGAGLGAIVPSAKFGFNKVSEGVQKATNKYKTSLEARLATNTLLNTLHVTKNPAAKKAVQDAIDANSTPSQVKAAKAQAELHVAQKQVDESVIQLKFRSTIDEVQKAADEGTLDANSALKEFAEELRAKHPTFGKIADAMAERINRAADKAEETQSMGAAKRKETIKTKIGDKAQDLADEHEAFRKALDDINSAFALARGVSKGAKDVKTEDMLNAMESVIARGVVEKAKIAGVKPKTVKLSQGEVNAAIHNKLKKYQKTINKADAELNEALKKAGLSDRNVLSPTVHRAMVQAGTTFQKFRRDVADNPEMGHKIEVKFDAHTEALIDDLYTAIDTSVKVTTVDDLGGALARTNRKTGEIKLRSNLTKEEILLHVKGALDNPVSAQKQVVTGQTPGLSDRLDAMSLEDLKRFIIGHEFAHTKQDLSTYQSDTKQSIAESLGLADPTNKYLSDSAIKLETEANNEALKRLDAAVEAKHAIEAAVNKLRADITWATLISKDRNRAETLLDPEWVMLSREFQESMGGDFAKLDELYNSKFNKTLRNQLGGFTRSYAGELAASRTPLAQWLALNIFELPGGTGGKVARRETAAISMEMFEAQAVHPVNVAWDAAVRAEAKASKLNVFDAAVMRHSSAAADKNANALGRKVQLEMNARQMGRQSDAPAHIKAYADELDKAYDHLYKIQHEHGVQGITGTNKLSHYTSQSWSEGRVLSGVWDQGGIGGENMTKLIAKSIRSRNPDASPRDIKDQAGSIIKRMEDNFTKRTDETKENIVSDGDYINSRTLHMDLDTTLDVGNGRTVSLLDFMDNDVTSQLNKYAKKSSATAAISKASSGRLNSADAIRSFIHAAGQESQAMGTHVDVSDMTNAFKLMMGEPIKAFDPRARKIRDAVALSGMNGLGESQLAELGLAMNRGTAALFATKQVAQRVTGKYGLNKWRGMMLTPEQAASTKVLSEMQSVSTLYDQMHNLARQNVHFDESYGTSTNSATVKALNQVVDTGTGGKYRPVLQHIQTKHTGYGSIRTMQEQIAMAGLMHDIGRKMFNKKSMTSDARIADVGVPMDLLRRKLKDGTLEIDDSGNITTLGLESWSAKEQHSLGVALRRHAAQQVQVGFAGETSALMSNPWVAFMMQFRSYPNIAAEKQQMRNAMFHDKEAAMGLTLNAASSMAARVIRYQSLALALPEDKRERYLNNKYNNLGHDTAMYMGGVGTMVNTYDMVMDPSEVVPPAASWANNYVKTAKGVTNGLGTQDVSNLMTAIPLGTIAQMNLIAGAIKELMSSDADETPRVTTRNRGS